MNETNKIRLFWAILGAILTLAIGVLTYHPTEYKETVKTIVLTDTITNVVTVRDTIYKPKPIERVVLRVDTVKADTVLVYESKRYLTKVDNDSVKGEIETFVSGVDCSVDTINWRFDIPTRTITNTITTEKVIKQRTHLNWGVGVGCGYGLINRKPDVYVGMFVGWSF